MLQSQSRMVSGRKVFLSVLMTGIIWQAISQAGYYHPITAVASASEADDTTLTPANLWIFGTPTDPARAVPFGSNGVRGILDLRTLTADSAQDMMRQYADLGISMTMTMRWKKPHPVGEQLFGDDNRDIPPTPQESAHAMSVLETIVTSDEAQRLKGKVYIQFLNEVGGGPGRASVEDMPGLLEFSTNAVAMIRQKAPWVKICGPAVTMGQILNEKYEEKEELFDKAAVVEDAIEWTAKYADAQDLHFHGVDGTYARKTVAKMRSILDDLGAPNVELVSWEWSVARFPNHDDSEAVRNAIIGMWQAFAEGGIVNAAYGSYWPNFARQKAGLDDPFAWISVVDEDGQPREPIYSTLLDIASGKITITQPDDRFAVSDDSQSQSSNSGKAQLITGKSSAIKVTSQSATQWVDGSSDDADTIENSGAGGVHEEIDLRTASSRDMKQSVHAFTKSNLGVAMTVRWSDPSSPVDFDSPPSSRDENRMISRLRAVLRSKDAKMVAENGLWVQFYDEIAGSHGRISMQDADAMFAFATQAAAKIRSSSPYVKIAGPALSDLELLSKTPLSSVEQEQYNLLVRAVDWSIANADAVNVHFDDSSADGNTFTMIQEVRSFIDSRPGGSGFPIVDWSAMSSKRISPTQTTVASKPTETKAQYKKRMNTFKKDYKNQLKDQYRSSGEKGWQKKWSKEWKSQWESEWEKHEAGVSGN